MQKRHFEAIARAVATANIAIGAKDEIARCLAIELAPFNPQFDRNRFITACLKFDGE